MPEGPSIVIAVEELAPFVGRRIFGVTGNSRQPIQRMDGQILREVFSHGKYLNFQFDRFALRIHFMLFGSYRVDEPREGREPRLTLTVTSRTRQRRQLLATDGGAAQQLAVARPTRTAYFYACSVRFVESTDLRSQYDFRIDIMSPEWNCAHVLRLVRALPAGTTVDDVLMDQTIFAGVGNIIKNEVLWRLRMLPSTKLGDLTPRGIGKLVSDARAYSHSFYELKKQYILRKNYQIYRKGVCPRGCGVKIEHRKTGTRQRMSHWCSGCQH